MFILRLSIYLKRVLHISSSTAIRVPVAGEDNREREESITKLKDVSKCVYVKLCLTLALNFTLYEKTTNSIQR